MEDWKSKLSALAGLTEPVQQETEKGKTEVARKKRSGVVFSTNPDFKYEDGEEEQPDTLPKNHQRLRLSMERAGRGGKTVTLVRGFVGTDADLQALCKLLKQKCGVGGSAKDGEIIIQGDHRTRLLDLLKKEGYTQAK